MTFSTGAAPNGLGLPRNEVLWMLMMAVIGFGVMVPVAGLLADAFWSSQEHDYHHHDDYFVRPVRL